MKISRNESGFSVLMILIGLVTLGIIGLVIWRTLNTKPVTVSEPTNQDPPSQVEKDPTEGWKKYCLGLCFKYPTAWVLKTIDLDLPPKVDVVEVSSPDTTTTVQFVPVVDGLGGTCQPNTCFFETLSIEPLKDPSLANLRIVKGIFTNSQTFWPRHFIASLETINRTGLKINQKTDTGYFAGVFNNIYEPSKISRLDVNNGSSTFTRQTALDWFNTKNAKTVEMIISTVELEN